METWKDSSCQSTFVGDSAQLPFDISDFAVLPAQRILAGNHFIVHCKMSCDLEVANESEHFCGKNSSYTPIVHTQVITIIFYMLFQVALYSSVVHQAMALAVTQAMQTSVAF